MRDLLKKIEYYTEMYFDEKIKNADVPDDVFEDIWDLVGNAEEDIEDIIRKAEFKIDEIIREHEKTSIPSRSEALEEDMKARQDELYSIDNDYYLTR